MSTKTKHSPGPWRVVNDTAIVGPGYDERADRPQPVIVEHSSGGIAFVEAKANARLIAAAPELYEALKDLLNECPQEFDGLPEHGRLLPTARNARIAKARAALAKADGK